MRISYDFTKIDEDRTTTEGEHEVEVAEMESKKTRKNDDGMNVAFNVVDENTSEGDPKKLWHFFTIKGNTMWVMRQFANACGVYPDASGLDTDELYGKRLKVRVEHVPGEGQYAGRINCQIAEFMPLA